MGSFHLLPWADDVAQALRAATADTGPGMPHGGTEYFSVDEVDRALQSTLAESVRDRIPNVMVYLSKLAVPTDPRVLKARSQVVRITVCAVWCTISVCLGFRNPSIILFQVV